MSLAQIGIVALVLALFAGAGYAIVHTYNGKIEEAARWKTAAEREQQTAREWMEESARHEREKERLDAVISERDRDRAKLTKETARLHDELKAAEKTDTTLQAWSAAPLPAFVVEQLRSVAADPGTSPAPAGKGSGKSSFWNQPATISRRD